MWLIYFYCVLFLYSRLFSVYFAQGLCGNILSKFDYWTMNNIQKINTQAYFIIIDRSDPLLNLKDLNFITSPFRIQSLLYVVHSFHWNNSCQVVVCENLYHYTCLVLNRYIICHEISHLNWIPRCDLKIIVKLSWNKIAEIILLYFPFNYRK